MEKNKTKTMELKSFIKIFLTMISVLAFTWSCSSALDESPSSFAFGDFNVAQDGATPIATDGVPVEGDSGIIEIPIELSGLTNRDGVEVTVEFTLAGGVTQHAEDGNTEAEGVLTLTIADPAGEEEIETAELGRFIIESNSIQYNLIVGGAFAAQATAPAPVVDTADTPDEIVVTLEGSLPTVSYDGALGYTVGGLINNDGVADGTISIEAYAPEGFTVLLGGETGSSVVLADPPGTDGVDYAEFTTITVTEEAYLANEVIYTISGGFAALGGVDPPPASSIIVTFLGSFSVGTPTETNLDVTLSGNTYAVAGLTNRSNVGVSLDTNDDFTVSFGYTISAITNAYTPTDETDASSSAVVLGTFTVTDDAITGDTGTIYTISGPFAAQATAPAPTGQIVVDLVGSVTTIDYDGVRGYTVNGLTNREVDGTISIDSYNPAGFTAVLGSGILEDPPGTDAVPSEEFTTITVTEDAYAANEVEYTISGGFAALGSVNPPPASAITVTFPGSFSVGTPTDTNLDVSFSGDTYTVAGLTNRSNEGVSFVTNAGFTVSSGYTISDITNTYTPTDDTDASADAVELGTFTITEDAITGDTGTTYTISGLFAAQATALAPTGKIVVTIEGNTPSIFYDGVLGYAVVGLTNRSTDGTISLDNYAPAGFTVVLGSEILEDPPGTEAVDLSELTTITVTEDVYPANEVEYTINGAFAVFGVTPPAASEITVTFLGSFSVTNPAIATLDVSLSGNTYTVAGLTNRSNEGVSFVTNAGFTVASGHTISDITNTYTPTDDTDASADAVELGTFTIKDDSVSGDLGVTYIISGLFAAQASLPSETTTATSGNFGTNINDVDNEAVFQYMAGQTQTALIAAGFTDIAFEYVNSASASGGTPNPTGVVVRLLTANSMEIDYTFTATQPSSLVATYTVRERGYTSNAVERSYTIELR